MVYTSDLTAFKKYFQHVLTDGLSHIIIASGLIIYLPFSSKSVLFFLGNIKQEQTCLRGKGP